MITKSGLLQFLKQICLLANFQRPNEVALSIPGLLDRVLNGFMASPVEWDGQLERTLWLQQFADMTVVLYRGIGNATVIDSDWHAKVRERINTLVSSLHEAQKNYSFIMPIPHMATVPSTVVHPTQKQDPFDMDTLFSYL
jgi:hypothetical protein